MKLYTHYMALTNRMRVFHILVSGLEYDAFTRDASPTTMALQGEFRRYLVRLGNWRDCAPCSEDWRKLKVLK